MIIKVSNDQCTGLVKGRGCSYIERTKTKDEEGQKHKRTKGLRASLYVNTNTGPTKR